MTQPHVMDLHSGPMAEEAWDFFFHFFHHINQMDKEIIVEGGWAVAAHGSPVASVDLDALVRTDEFEDDHDFYDLLHAEGNYARENAISSIDWSFLEGVNLAWASTKGYDREALLEGRTMKVVLQAPDGRTQEVTVPTIPALLVMKLKAFRDRDLQFRIMQDPSLIASYDPHEIEQIHHDAAYRLRKPAKDLVDIGFLWKKASEGQRQEAIDLLRRFGLDGLIERALREPAREVVDAADYLIQRHKLDGTAGETLGMLREAIQEDSKARRERES